jgi:D-sedoheptulose 7-phosphate isomerase
MKPANPERLVAARIEDSVAIKQAFLRDQKSVKLVAEVAALITNSIRNNGKVFFFGNGGSAADAQHLAAELAGRYLLERPGLPGLALTTNTSSLTAIANDYGYEMVFARQLQALAASGDIAVAISTSGNSGSVLLAAEAARKKQMITVALTGAGGGKLKPLVDHCICAPSEHPARVQELHILIGHILCEIVEQQLFDAGGIS